MISISIAEAFSLQGHMVISYALYGCELILPYSIDLIRVGCVSMVMYVRLFEALSPRLSRGGRLDWETQSWTLGGTQPIRYLN